MFRSGAKYAGAALLLAGSAALLFSCERKEVRDDAARAEAVRTEYSENLTIVKSENGRKMYHFTTPLLEGYTEARDPYREFRKGVRIVTYKNDSLASEDARLRANYAIFYSERNLWEVKGNVVVETGDDRELYTEQLFWNAKTKRIYSNVDTKIVQNGGRDVFYGEGLESDDALRDWRFPCDAGRSGRRTGALRCCGVTARCGRRNGAGVRVSPLLRFGQEDRRSGVCTPRQGRSLAPDAARHVARRSRERPPHR